MPRLLIGLLCLLASFQVQAVIETYQFEDESTRHRYHVLVEELRCPKCQNQNLSGSNSPIAKDLRRELYRLLNEGYSDEAIKDYMVQRYGEYILYRPRLSDKTMVLWAAPAALLLLGLILLLVVVRRRQQRAGQATDNQRETASDLSDDEQARLKEILEHKND
jgi:cytochrome c-type biogenesis protein CcmH